MKKFNEKFNEMTDQELIWWFVMALNGADFHDPEECKLYDEACAESLTRSKEVQGQIDFIIHVL